MMVEWLVGCVLSPVTFLQEITKVNKDTGGITRLNGIACMLLLGIAAGTFYLWNAVIPVVCLVVMALIALFMNGEVFALVTKMGGYAAVSAAVGTAIAGVAFMMFAAPFPQMSMGVGILVFIGMSVRFGL